MTEDQKYKVIIEETNGWFTYDDKGTTSYPCRGYSMG